MHLVISDLSRSFRTVKALEHVSMDIQSGRVTGLLGQNGAGKTTLLKLIAGLLKPDSGQVSIDGAPVRKSQIGLLLGGDTGLYPNLTPRENIRYFADLHHVPEKVFNARLKEYGKQFSLDEYMDRPCGQLSRGTRQKTSIIRAMIHNPEIILFDEPETGLDFETTESIMAFLRDSAAADKLVLYSSHSIGTILTTCSTAVILHYGKTVETLDVRQIQENHSITEAYEIIERAVSSDAAKGDE